MEHRQDPDLNHEVTQPMSITLFYEETVMKWVFKKMFFQLMFHTTYVGERLNEIIAEENWSL